MGGNGFSSLKNFDTLKEAGFNESQARALLEMMSQDSASRQDLEYATAELKREIEANKAELKRDIKELDNKIEITKAELKRDIAELKRDIEVTKAELEGKIETTKTDLKNDFFNKMAWFSLAIITVLGGLMNYLKFFAD